MAVDTKRNLLYLYGGLNQVCNNNALGSDSNPRRDTYILRLNADPKKATWERLYPTTFPASNASSAAMVYSPDDDVMFVFGSDSSSQTSDHWVYCRTVENPTPGVLTAKQSAAGCARPDDWSKVNPVSGIVNTQGSKVTLVSGTPFPAKMPTYVNINGTYYTVRSVVDSKTIMVAEYLGNRSNVPYYIQPPGVAFGGLAYDTVTKKVIQYGGQTGNGIVNNETWAYDIPTRQWTQKALNTPAPPLVTKSITPQPAIAYNSRTHKILYHFTSATPSDWEYDPVADTWTQITSTGTGAIRDQNLVYDSANDVLVGWSQHPVTAKADVWIGKLNSSAAPAPQPTGSCDVNSDGKIDVTDVQTAISQALGSSGCTTSDVTGDKTCTVVDVQRITNAALGSACETGP
jgi:hypothetical protein